jgi:serine/threonine protein kinase
MGETLPEIVEQIMNGDYEYPSPYWDNVSEKAKDFVSKLLVTDKNVRMTATQALSHPWIRDSASAPTNPLQNQDLKTKASKLKRMQ